MLGNLSLAIYPYIRFVILVLVAGAVSNSPLYIDVLFYCFVMIPLYQINRRLKQHFKIVVFAILPIFITMMVFHYLLPNGDYETWEHIFQRLFKLIISTSILQFIFVIPMKELFVTFKTWGFRNEALITLLGSFTVWREVQNRAEKIVTARLARGYIKKRSIIQLASQLPYVLNPLLIGVMRTSIDRANSWEQKNILQLVNSFNVDDIHYSKTYNAIIVLASLGYLIISNFIRL